MNSERRFIVVVMVKTEVSDWYFKYWLVYVHSVKPMHVIKYKSAFYAFWNVLTSSFWNYDNTVMLREAIF